MSRAKDKGVTHLALTDHDSIEGVTLAQAQAQLLGMELIAGIELSTQWKGIGVHVVGLNVSLGDSELLEAIHAQNHARTSRGIEIGQRLAKLGFEGAYEGALDLAGNSTLGRPHFAQFLVAEGVVKDFNEAFKKYLGAGKVGDIKQCWLSLEEVIRSIVNAGGIAVLAHPLKYKMTLSKLRRLVAAFSEAGGQAIEVSSGQQSLNQTQSMAQIAQQYSLLASCGSDFHAPVGWQELGQYSRLPPQCVPVWDRW